jgi:hypothetical protein
MHPDLAISVLLGLKNGQGFSPFSRSAIIFLPPSFFCIRVIRTSLTQERTFIPPDATAASFARALIQYKVLHKHPMKKTAVQASL